MFQGDKKSVTDVRPGRGIAFRLSLWILLSSAIIFMMVLGYYYALSRRAIVEKIEQYAGEMAKGNAARIDTILAATQKIPHNLSALISGAPFGDSRKLRKLITTFVEHNPEIYGMAVAFEPYAWDGKSRYFSPYVYRKHTGIDSMLITYDYFSWDWYKLPVQRSQPQWAEPYFDEGAGNIIMSTYSVPFYRSVAGSRTLAGVVTVDISLERLQKIISEIHSGGTGYAFLVSQNGTFVTHPDKRLIMNKTIFGLAGELGDTSLNRLSARMTAGETGVVESRNVLDGDKCWLAFAPLSTTGWSLGIVFPRDELMKDVTRHSRITLLLGAAGLLILCSIIIWIARGITQSLRTLNDAARTLTAGDLNTAIPVIHSHDEVGSLAVSFSAMRESLQTYIRDLTQTTAAKERIESELKIAHDIQMGMLPRTFPPFPLRTDMDIFATLKPAREVGGDLYDFFFMDDDHLCFTVGDVSGKGVPAALLMAVTKILIKSKAAQGFTADKIITRVNEDLAQDNPSMMFVTLFLGILNIHTGEVFYCNAGHPSPYILRSRGGVEVLPATGGMALGVVEDFAYSSKQLKLNAHDSVLLYSDGITEATDSQGNFFAEARLEKALVELSDQPLKALVDGVVELVTAFAGDAPQADDITIMVMRYLGNKV
ncbi:MAG: serine/threonine protein phosphatase [Deltaproteobacteria bacterium HGW-Deltaproteobacteria-12]|jgi:sigma-B regulation protein RsbU (phosphoserine phosphatase)|nr:MAG: serine/threonine protein phosphatase [Deltaproteobacteria bacterium HGW-Deltaproteobacteria-12]